VDDVTSFGFVSEELRFEFTRPGPHVCRLAVRGAVDIATVAAFRSAVAEAGDAETKRLELDLRDVSFMGACGIPVVEEAAARFGSDLVLVGVSRFARQVLEFGELDAWLDDPSAERT
jgi:anti-anti-sigma factor